MKVVLGLGSNLGDRAAALDRACRRLEERKLLAIRRRSRVVESAPLGPPQPDYLNQVVAGETAVSAEELLSGAKAIERELGRTSGPRWGPRPIDIDILVWGERPVEAPGLRVPHPELARRRFVLAPWAEIEPDFVVPGLRATVRDLLAALDAENARKGSAP